MLSIILSIIQIILNVIIIILIFKNRKWGVIMKNNIKNVRESKGMTQRECADILEISLRAWQTYEQGVSEPKQALLCKIADMFSVSIDYLLGREIGEPETIDKLVGEFNMSALEKEILDNYLSLPKDMRGDLMEFLQKSVQKVMNESGE